MVTFSLVVVRHGATDANEQGIIQGQSDHKLNEAGRRQALLLGRHFRQCQLLSSFTHSYSSDLSRAKETAEIILGSLQEGDNGLAPKWSGNDDEEKRSKLICDKRLRERKYGVLEGKSTSVHKQAAMKSNVSPAEYTPEGGETLWDLYERVSDFFRDLCLRVAAMSHNQTSSTSRSNIASTPPSPRIGGDNLPQQLQNGAGSNRNSRVQMPSSKVIRTSSLIPLPEQTSTITATSPASAGITTTAAIAHPVFYLPEPPRREPCRAVSAGKRGSTNGEENNEAASTRAADLNGTSTARPSFHDGYSPFASSRDSGISAVSNGSLFVDTQLAERRTSDSTDRPPKRSYSACSSPGFSPCSASPGDSSDVTGDGTMEKAPPTPASMHVTNSWAYLYGAASRTVGARKVSVQSIASDDANFPDLDAQILVVTHGGAIRELFRYFVDELGCLMIGGKGAALRPCPNTGVSSFMVSVNMDNEVISAHDGKSPADPGGLQPKNISVICLGLHSKEHLTPWSVPVVSLGADSEEDSWFSKRPHTPPCDVSDFFAGDGEDDDENGDAVGTATSSLPNGNLGRESLLL